MKLFDKDSLLFAYQKRIMEDDSRYVILTKSRRIGGTFIFALKTIVECLQNGYNGWFSSNDHTNGLEYIRYVKQWSSLINTFLGYEYIRLDGSTTEKVELPNGTRITALSSSPSALRGKDGVIILDEMAARTDQEEVMTAAQGCIIQRGKLYLLSSHNGPTTVFYNIATAEHNGWSKHVVTLLDALEDGYAERFAKHLRHLPDKRAINSAFVDEIKKITLSDEQYRQEYLCEPLSLQSLISAGEYDELSLWDVPEALDPDHDYSPLYIGIDVGRTRDFTVIWVLERYLNPEATNDHDRYDYKTVCVKWLRAMDIPSQFQHIKQVVQHKDVANVLIDMGSVGRPLSDALVDAYPNIVVPYSFTAQRKAALCERVKGYVQYKRVSLPLTPIIREDILSMRRQSSKSGNLSYDGHTRETHCDFFIALSMALEAAVTSGETYIVGLR